MRNGTVRPVVRPARETIERREARLGRMRSRARRLRKPAQRAAR